MRISDWSSDVCSSDLWYLSDPGPSGLFTRLARLGLLVDAFQHQALDGVGLRFIDFSVLRLLQLAGSPYQLSPSELAELTLRSTGAIGRASCRDRVWSYV